MFHDGKLPMDHMHRLFTTSNYYVCYVNEEERNKMYVSSKKTNLKGEREIASKIIIIC